jgi:site-specific recombinase XerD
VGKLLNYSQGRTRPRTVDFYRDRLRPFADIYGDKPIADLTTEDIENFVAGLLRQLCKYADHQFRQQIQAPLSISYVKGFERAVRRLLLFAQARGWLSADRNPWRSYTPIRPDRRARPKSCKTQDISRLLAVASGDSSAHVRDRTIVKLLCDTGCRVSGLANLCWQNIDWQNRRFETEEKGKACIYHFSIQAGNQLEEWKKVYPPNLQHDYVFIDLRTSEPLTIEGIQSALKRLKRRAGVRGPANPHSFRHHFAIATLAHGLDLKAVSQMMNHSGVQVTADTYGEHARGLLDRLHDEYSPLNDLEAPSGDLWYDDDDNGGSEK